MTMNKSHKRLKALELFAGAGGMALGIQKAGIDVIGLVEIDEKCLATLSVNKKRAFPKAEIIKADIAKTTGNYLLKRVGVKKGKLDLLSGGPPCQGFTFASKNRSINDPRSILMYHYVRLVGEINPRYFVIENVPGMFSFKDFFIALLELLEGKGYIVRFILMDACNYGVPQHRVRVFIHGARKDLKIVPEFPSPTHFDLDSDKAFPPVSLVALKCFSINGFAKEEVKDVWWNKKLNILMNKKTAAEKIDQAVRQIFLEGLIKQTIKKLNRKSHEA